MNGNFSQASSPEEAILDHDGGGVIPNGGTAVLAQALCVG